MRRVQTGPEWAAAWEQTGDMKRPTLNHSQESENLTLEVNYNVPVAFHKVACLLCIIAQAFDHSSILVSCCKSVSVLSDNISRFHLKLLKLKPFKPILLKTNLNFRVIPVSLFTLKEFPAEKPQKKNLNDI